MKHTPTAEQIRTLKITMEEEIDRNGDEYEDVNENCRYWLNNINDIVHAVKMHEKIVEALKHAHNSLRTFRNVPKDDQEWTPIDDEAMKLIEETLSQAERK